MRAPLMRAPPHDLITSKGPTPNHIEAEELTGKWEGGGGAQTFSV